MKEQTKVVQDANAPEIPAEVIAQEIEKIARGMEAMTRSRLTFDTIVLLVSAASKVGKPSTRDVLIAARALAKTYLKPEPAMKATR